MNGPEHYAEAERLIEFIASEQNAIPEQRVSHAVLAQVHATLALAAATLVGSEAGYSAHRITQWEPAIGPSHTSQDPWSA